MLLCSFIASTGLADTYSQSGNPRRTKARERAGLVAALALAGLCFAGAGIARAAQPADAARYSYISPSPGSRTISPGNSIAIRPGGAIDPRSIGAGTLSVVGSTSGVVPGTCHLSDDSRTLIFEPLHPYAAGEEVSVTLAPGARTASGASLPPLAFHFSVASWNPATLRRFPDPAPLPEPGATPARVASPASAQPPVLGASDLPTGYPNVVTLAYDNPDPGYVFMTPTSTTDIASLMIVDNLGQPIFFRRSTSNLLDLKKQPNGLLTYFDLARAKFYALDTLYAVVDSFAAGNGYTTDTHDLQLIPGGHALLLIYDTQPVGMDTVVAGGDPNALVMGLVVQELDASKNVVFQWRSWDHIQITDAVGVDLTAPNIDAVHGNAVELDTDGNLMISSRHLNEITKINRETGDIIWRWGLNAVHNDFTFVGDTRGFAYQHDIRRTADGHVTLFDNGNVLTPAYSRALEYDLDEQNKVATLVREVLPTGGGLSHSSGSVQKRTGGGMMIGWGAGSLNRDMTDLHPDGSIALEFTFPTQTWTTYRALRADWKATLIGTDTDLVEFGAMKPESTVLKTLTIKNNSTGNLVISSIVNTNTSAFAVLAPTPFLIPHGQSTDVYLQFHPHAFGSMSGTLYVRSGTANQLIAHPVQVHGTGIDLTDAPERGASRGISLAQSRPNPARDGLAIAFSIARAGDVSLSVHDPAGRVVATLLDGPMAAGEHVVRWDGVTRDGRKAPPGIYLYELRASGERLQRRLILLR